ncbi:MAG: hypothetical protein JWM76_2691 [Pseudonocardiales bacterium]|nr:hypothetical protein [Pseudonocardiales bacterium]
MSIPINDEVHGDRRVTDPDEVRNGNPGKPQYEVGRADVPKFGEPSEADDGRETDLPSDAPTDDPERPSNPA